MLVKKITKEYIQNNLLNKTGKINSSKVSKYNKKEMEELYCIYHNTKPKTCPYCKEPSKFINFNKGYKSYKGYCSEKCFFKSITLRLEN